ncbi:MAG TPA: GTPase ObgE [Dehalococcoidia bacterium]|jgi:GTP-binding protein|nr:GTPase ObgE [Chloroflexota bacterium]MDP6055337.1 GTPase ObgE [Dehalococcoidia bacterium]MDP7262190.1 GTPase ObgE [Dehalococcoidia bacterium]MDP7485657.1 GTPase ObgE [Dehalococcoidia bacterium]HJP27607.1 GTPase ObgE [Dehalococcoidia bacterium]|tara:strand:- start:16358 stop:17647 length:1290 start_codon:yes stop_codon:yes gene_type:complete
MLDSAVIEVRAGNGGHGLVAFIREALLPRGGPGGGDGGHGGDVVLIADPSINTLAKFHWQPHFIAKNGTKGDGHRRNGAKGEAIETTVPVGTEVWIWEDGEDKELIGDLNQPGQRMIVAEGGRGGWGNTRFVSATNQEPLLAEAGGDGEIRRVRLNLKLLADVGLVGMPNAGKSSILTAISAAQPKVADYPFTTLEPVLGVVEHGPQAFVAVDIPGLIEGAHEGIGLGDEFLKHVQRTRVLVHVVDGSEDDVPGRIKAINDELEQFDPKLAKKPQILAINKLDLDEVSVLIDEIKENLKSADGLHSETHFVSAATYDGLDELKQSVFHLLRSTYENEEPAVEVAVEDIPVLRPSVQQSTDVVVRDPDGPLRIVHQKAVRLAKGSNLESHEARLQFHRRLEQLKVTKALRDAGLETGDTVLVGDWEFDWD